MENYLVKSWHFIVLVTAFKNSNLFALQPKKQQTC